MNSTLLRLLWYTSSLVKRPRLFEYLKTKSQACRFSRPELERYQLAKLQKLVTHAYQNTAFYRQKYDQFGVRPEQIKTLDDLQVLPLVTKEDIRSRIDDFVSCGYDKNGLRKMYSGGSTGIPTMVYHPPETGLFNLSQTIVANRWMGVQWGDRAVHIWGLNRANTPYELANISFWRRFISNTVVLDAFNLTEERIARFAQILQQFNPIIVVGYVSTLVPVADFLGRQKITIRSLKAVVATAETLRLQQRQIIERGFGVPVFEQYGSTEIMWIAQECCQHRGLHIIEDSRLVESLPIQDTGYSELVVTDLENYACPLIRYQNNDLGRVDKSPCGCGLPFARITSLQGRISDMFKLPSGKLIHGEYFTHVFYEYGDVVKQFQVHQTGIDTIIVRLALSREISDSQKQEMEERIVGRFSEASNGLIRYIFEYAKSIPIEASGKFRFTKSDCT